MQEATVVASSQTDERLSKPGQCGGRRHPFLVAVQNVLGRADGRDLRGDVRDVVGSVGVAHSQGVAALERGQNARLAVDVDRRGARLESLERYRLLLVEVGCLPELASGTLA